MVEEFNQIVRMYKTNKRSLAHQIVALGLAVAAALMLWKSLMLISHSESPIVVVLSGSMEPSFFRGDLMFLSFYDEKDPFDAGDIVVFRLRGKNIPIVHRIIRLHHSASNPSKFWALTKGDNNRGDDRTLYPLGQKWIERQDVLGRAFGSMPAIGMVTILMNEYPPLQFALIGFLALLVITNKE